MYIITKYLTCQNTGKKYLEVLDKDCTTKIICATTKEVIN